jgi:Domain of unknown function (DUF4326)
LVNSIAAFATARDATLPKCPAGQDAKTREKMRAAPGRLQLRRSKGWRMPANTVKVDRATLFGNPFLAVDYGSNGAVALFRAWITGRCANVCLAPEAKRALARRRTDILGALPALRGKNLACWCPLPSRGEPDTCHAAVLLELANRRSPPSEDAIADVRRNRLPASDAANVRRGGRRGLRQHS